MPSRPSEAAFAMALGLTCRIDRRFRLKLCCAIRSANSRHGSCLKNENARISFILR